MKTVTSETSLDLRCYRYMLDDDVMMSQVKAVEEMMQIESSEIIDESLTNEQLKTAAQMFLFLNTCPNTRWFKSWFSFYKDLFLTKSADQIILTLNRMIKTETSHDKAGKLRAKKLLQRNKSLLSLQFEEIGRLLGEKYFEAITGTEFIIPNGAVFTKINIYLLIFYRRFKWHHHQPSSSYYHQ